MKVISKCCTTKTIKTVNAFQVIHNVSRKYHDAIVKCEVHNAVGKSEESETLDISCKFNESPYKAQTKLLSSYQFHRWSGV